MGRTGRVIVLDHPVAAHRVVTLRDASTGGAGFRQVVHELSTLLAYEALRDLSTEPCTVTTPVGVAEGRRVNETVLVVPVLRAGLGMVPAVQELLPYTDVAYLGLRRDELTLESQVYLDRLPADLAGRRVVVCDPMIATGGSLGTVCDLILGRGASHVQVLCLIAAAPGLAAFTQRHPDVDVACCAVDPALNAHGYIVPGLGDAGDRQFGPPT